MLAFLRAPYPPRTKTATQEILSFEDGRAKLQFNPPESEFRMTHTVPPTTTTHGVSLAQPPLHYHLHQEETFRVKSGSALLFLGTNKKPFATIDVNNPNAFIPAGRYHRFENASQTVDLVIEEKKSPADDGVDQRFFRNTFGYLDDCKKAKVEPSVFQLIVFAHAADTPLALPAPFGIEVLGFWISRVFTIVMAFAGRQMGYQQSYPEYFQDKKHI